MTGGQDISKPLKPARVLLIDQDPAFAAGLREILGRRAQAQAWLWHERTPELALTLLSVCEFDLILFTIPDVPHSAARLVDAIAETALGQSLLLLRHGDGEPYELGRSLSAIIGIASRDDIDQVGQAVTQALGYPDQVLAS